MGRLPYVLRRDLERLTINGGDFAWGGGAPWFDEATGEKVATGEIIVHTERGESYKEHWTGDILFETMIHEATHVSVDWRVRDEYLFEWQTAV